MKRALLFLAVCAGFFSSSQAQVSSITVEAFYTDNGSVAGYPAGHTTYRIYANTQNASDRVTTVSGSALNPMALSVTGSGIWNYNAGGVAGDALPCIIFNSQPLAQYDSYLTIGVNCNNDGAANPIYTAEDGAQTWQTEAFNTAPYGDGNFVVNSTIGGTWFVLPDNPNASAGSDLKILLAQITTDGDVCGTFNLQEFPNGSAAVYSTFSFSNITGCVPGCDDNNALNFDPLATYNDGTCLLPCSIDLNASVITPISCAGDEAEISLTATGSQAFYNFDENGLSSDGSITLPLTAGEYTFYVYDTRFDDIEINPNGLVCVDSVTISIDEILPVFIGESVTQDEACPGDANGSVSTEVTNYGGGTGDLTFYLIGENDTITLSSPNYSNLSAGSYFFEVMDVNGCSATGSTFSIGSPSAISITGGVVTADCSNSTDVPVILEWSGGTGDVDFSLTANGPYNIEGTGSDVTVIAESIGVFTIYAQDTLGCTSQATFEVVGAPAIAISSEITPISCFGLSDGELTVSATGGTGSFTYAFNAGSLSSNNTLGGLAASTVDVVVQDANGCQSSASFQIEEPAALSALGNATSVSCNGSTDGQIEIVVNGGTAPYIYALDQTPVDNNFPVIEDLSPGSYIIHVVDANGCSFVATEPTVVTSPEVLSATVVTTDACFGQSNGSIVVTALGGTGPFQYSIDGLPLSSNNVFNGLAVDDYSIIVIDVNNCDTSATASISSPSEALAIDGLSAVAGGSSDYNVIGGTPPFQYSWTGPNGYTSVAEALEGMNSLEQSGEYVLTVTDASGCTASQTIIIIGLNEVNAFYQIEMYPNPNNGQFTLSMTGLTGEAVNYTVLDNSGRVILSKDLGSVGASRVESVEMHGAAAGLYQLRISVDGQVQSRRFVKQ
jgi:hypothetical protein